MDANPAPSDVPTTLKELVMAEGTWRLLCDEWDGMDPDNPVLGDSEEEE